ncbi:hypothetical protein [Streptomyces sp. NPDC058579]|uniref:hypothetical protein n=1 Tax=Streptomyces sp. NPDC058579 TaxID=3346548 RepID=UPI00366782FA
MAAGGSDRGRANVPRSTTTPVRKALTSLDHRVELAVGYTVDRLWRDHDRGLLDEQIESVAGAHRSLSSAEQSVTFYRVLLQRLASGEYPMDSALFDRIGRTVKQLQEAVRIRGVHETELSDVLEPVEANAPPHPGWPRRPESPRHRPAPGDRPGRQAPRAPAHPAALRRDRLRHQDRPA